MIRGRRLSLWSESTLVRGSFNLPCALGSEHVSRGRLAYYSGRIGTPDLLAARARVSHRSRGPWLERRSANARSDFSTCECLELEVGKSLKAEDVVRVMERLKYYRGVPARIYCENGCEFLSAQMDQWACANSVKIEFSRLGKQTGRVEMWRSGGRNALNCCRPFRLAVSQSRFRNSVSTSRSSNRTCRFPASGSHA